jgi:hypothetical protein
MPLKSAPRKQAEPTEANLASRYARRGSAALSARYSPLNESKLLSIQNTDGVTARLFREAGLSTLRGLEILDLARCGQYSSTLIRWVASAANLYGIEVPPQGAEGRFDIVCQSTAFTQFLTVVRGSVPPRRVHQLLRPGGKVMWYDCWINPRSLDPGPYESPKPTGCFQPAESRERWSAPSPAAYD